MRDLLHLIFEYRRLLAKSEVVAGSLPPHAQERLLALEKLFGQEPDTELPSSALRRHARCQLRAAATIRIDGRVQPVNLINLGGGGVCISPAPNVPAGETALLRIVSEDRSRVYQYQVQARWAVRNEGDSQMGMPFVGIPRELPIEDDHSQRRLGERFATGSDPDFA